MIKSITADNPLAHTLTHVNTVKRVEFLGSEPFAEFQIYMKGKEGRLCSAFIQAFLPNLNIFHLIYSCVGQLSGLAELFRSREKLSGTVPPSRHVGIKKKKSNFISEITGTEVLLFSLWKFSVS